MHFDDFWTNFCDFLTFVLFYSLKWALQRALLLEQFLVYKWLQFYIYKVFFVEKYDENWKIGTIFLNFLQFFVFLSIFRQYLSLF